MPARKTATLLVSSTPKRHDFSANEAIELAFTNLARLEASTPSNEAAAAETVEPPLVFAGGIQRARIEFEAYTRVLTTRSATLATMCAPATATEFLDYTT